MATYFHGSSEPSDGIQTLYLMNPNYLSSYTDTTHHPQQHPPNMLFFNPTANALSSENLAHARPPSHQLVGVPLPGPATNNSGNHGRPSTSLHGVIPGIQYNLWASLEQNPAANDSGEAQDLLSFRRPVVVSPAARQGLSLSLSSQLQHVAPNFRPLGNEHDVQAMDVHVSGMSSGEDMRVSGNSPSSVSAVSNGASGVHSVVLGSKYLRATQELLDEVVDVGKGMKSDLLSSVGNKDKTKMNKDLCVTGDGSSGGGVGESSVKRGADLTTAQRQDLQMKKAKLVNMLDEVEHRYRQYHHQMQIVVSSFEHAAGLGAAKSYTSLALQTISKQFRCLKDAISGQIKATSKNLGEEDCLGAKLEGSRLRYVDHQLRQQRALQQLGMMQHNAWRPQRGLPERAVSVLRAWLFEHFLHPYPKDSDKHMLAKQTGLTRSQVSNWFINARVRLWKPMVEEMYLEEVKEQEKHNGSDGENRSKNENKEPGSNSIAPGETRSTLQMDQLKALQSKADKPTNQNGSQSEFSNSSISMSPIQLQPGFTLIRPSEMEGITQSSPKKPRSTSGMRNSPSSILSMDMDMRQAGETNRDISVNFGGAFGAYPMGDLGRFNPEQLTTRFSGNGVSLTLGLPHCENLSLSGTQQNYLPNQSIQLGRRLEIGTGEPDFCGIGTSQNSHSSGGFESIDLQNPKRFAAPLLPDFVA